MEIKELLSYIIAGVSNTYGDKFLNRITLMLGRVIGADYTFIAMIDREKYESRMVALTAKGENAPNMIYSLTNTPCANVVDDSVCCYPSGVCDIFPKDQLLVDMKIEAYIGTPLHNSKGEVMGLIVALYENKIEHEKDVVTLFQIFSGRISAEIERNEYEMKLEKYNQELSVLVKQRTLDLELALATLKNNQRQMLESEKMASLGILSAGIAHEINNPLNFIKGGVELLEDYIKDHFPGDMENLSPILGAILEGVSRSTAIVKGLNQFNRDTENTEEMINIHEVLDNCLAMVLSQTRNQINIDKKYIETDAICYGNGGKLHQAFLNIIGNAIQSIEKEGEIKIITEKRKGNLLIHIKDSGCGISKDNLAKISTPFFTTKAPGSGTGLGLSITYQIVADHNGSIHVNSEVNKGSEFTVMLPTGV